HNRTVPSSPPVASRVAAGEKARPWTWPVWPGQVVSCPVSRSQRRTADSGASPTAARGRPSDEKATWLTAVGTGYLIEPPLTRSCRRTLRSSPPEASHLPSRLKATQRTTPVCPERGLSSLPLSTSQRLTVPFSPPAPRILL